MSLHIPSDVANIILEYYAQMRDMKWAPFIEPKTGKLKWKTNKYSAKYDNINKLLGDDLKISLSPNSRLKIAASCFSMYAFEALKAELEKIDELQNESGSSSENELDKIVIEKSQQRFPV